MVRGLTKKRDIVLRDGGFTIMLLLIFASGGIGLIAGFALDGVWNYLVFNFTLNRRLDLPPDQYPGPIKKMLYIFVITLIGFVIDFAYEIGLMQTIYGLSRGFARSGTSTPVSLATNAALELLWFLAAMIAVGLVNLGLGRWYLRIQGQSALKFGAWMGFLTAP